MFLPSEGSATPGTVSTGTVQIISMTGIQCDPQERRWTVKVFVHGNPETDDIWGPLRTELSRRGIDDTVCLSPPGFGAPTPKDWKATRQEYVDWLVAELRRLRRESEEPVHLVGHDWGAGHVFGALACEPDLVSSWAADCAGLLHPDYRWHDAARQWQTAGEGESAVEGLLGLDADTFATVFGSLGMTDEVARRVHARLDAETGRSILALYRDAAQPVMAELGARFVVAAPRHGLVIVAENDTYAGPHETHRSIATAIGADIVELVGVGHWWMTENPEAAADALVMHWQRYS